MTSTDLPRPTPSPTEHPPARTAERHLVRHCAIHRPTLDPTDPAERWRSPTSVGTEGRPVAEGGPGGRPADPGRGEPASGPVLGHGEPERARGCGATDVDTTGRGAETVTRAERAAPAEPASGVAGSAAGHTTAPSRRTRPSVGGSTHPAEPRCPRPTSVPGDRAGSVDDHVPIPYRLASPPPGSGGTAAGPAGVATRPSEKPGRPRLTTRPTEQAGADPTATQPFGEEIRLARTYLMRVAEPPASALLAFVDAVGPVEAAKRVRAAEVAPAVLHETSARRHLDQAAGDLADAEDTGARLVVPEDEDWPAWQLLCLSVAADRGQRWSGAPLGLWVRGPASPADVFDRAVSVVGARAASSYGEHVAAELGYGLASAGMTVVSGAAFGIDGAAHRGALNAGGRTVAVLGCGVDVDYPRGHAALLDRIAERGLVLSEYPPGTQPAKHRFLVRNRLIAALSTATVVVEAGVRSGARNTATTAAGLGKVVMAVPGPITSAMSVGCHDLLRTGAAMLAGSVAEVLEAVGPVGQNIADQPEGPHRRTDGLGEEALRVHEALRRRTARSTAQVAVDSGVPLDRVRALLPELEITGLAERCEEGWRQTPG